VIQYDIKGKDGSLTIEERIRVLPLKKLCIFGFSAATALETFSIKKIMNKYEYILNRQRVFSI